MNKKQVKIIAIIIAVIFLLGIAGPLAYIAFSEPDSSGLSDIDEMSDADINAKIKELGDQITAAEKESAELDKKAEAADELDKKQTEESGRRFRIMCERGISSYLDIIFSSTDLSDFNDRIVIAKELAEYDKKVANALKDVKREIADAKEEKLRLSEQLKSSKEELERLSAARQAERHRAESNDRQVSQNNADSSDDE
ncbi:MAG: hypothetical protein KH216_05830 [Clostridiales bacterium]|nr:hypothetical protein [Clostridiales bacterium]